MKESNITTFSITPSTFAWALFFGLLVVGLYHVRGIILILLTAIVIASFVEAPTRWLIRLRIPRVVSVIIVYLGIAGLLGGLLSFLIPAFLSEVDTIALLFPDSSSVDFLQQLNLQGIKDAMSVTETDLQKDPVHVFESLQLKFGQFAGTAFQSIAVVFGGFLNAIMVFILSFFLAVEDRGIEKFLRLVIPVDKEEYVTDLWKRAQRKIEIWFSGQLLAALFVGVMVYLGLLVFGIPYALLLALLSFVFELVPFGSMVAGIPALAIAFLTGGFPLLIYVLVLYAVIQQIEGNIIYPLVMKRVVGIPPVIVIISLLVGGALGGVLGIVIAMPVTVGLFEFISDVEKEKGKHLRPL
jgi:predicted PurR-regulated permease PerM